MSTNLSVPLFSHCQHHQCLPIVQLVSMAFVPRLMLRAVADRGEIRYFPIPPVNNTTNCSVCQNVIVHTTMFTKWRDCEQDSAILYKVAF